MNENKLKIKDLVNIGIFSTIYGCFIANNDFSNVFSNNMVAMAINSRTCV